MIDLRSDTITTPTKDMLKAMMSAKVGDDVFEEDPTVNYLQEKVVKMFGMEGALFCPSGTMTNQIAMRILTHPQDEVLCHKDSHVYLYEGGGMAYNAMISPKLLSGKEGKITGKQIGENINSNDVHFPISKLVILENTMNKGGGSYYTLEEIQEIKKICDEYSLKLHLDGARVFNALEETKDNPKSYGKLFNTISVCFSKGLGAPIGSVLIGTNKLITKARRVRKVLGGGMRQAGYLAAACIYALDHNINRLKEDHVRAKEVGDALSRSVWVKNVYPVKTNIVIGEVSGCTEQEFLKKLQKHNILAVPFGKQLVRFVTHLNFDDQQLDYVTRILPSKI